MTDKVTWLAHEFSVYQHNASWNDKAGIYIFCGVNQQNQWAPLYVGQASSFAERIANHERWQEAARLGATHVHALVVSQQATRDQIEAELIFEYQPPLNDRLR